MFSVASSTLVGTVAHVRIPGLLCCQRDAVSHQKMQLMSKLGLCEGGGERNKWYEPVWQRRVGVSRAAQNAAFNTYVRYQGS